MEGIREIVKGRVRLYDNEEGYTEKFGRFVGDGNNELLDFKVPLAGQEGTVRAILENKTVGVEMDLGGMNVNFPMEAIAE